MSTEGEKRKDPGDAVREGVRSVIGILGALKDAIEDTFEELRTGGEATPEEAKEAARSTFRAAQDAVEDVRDRLDFITRKEFDALREEVAGLEARVNALSESAHRTGDSSAGAEDTTGTGGSTSSDQPEPAADPRGDDGSEGGGDFRFEVE